MSAAEEQQQHYQHTPGKGCDRHASHHYQYPQNAENDRTS